MRSAWPGWLVALVVGVVWMLDAQRPRLPDAGLGAAGGSGAAVGASPLPAHASGPPAMGVQATDPATALLSECRRKLREITPVRGDPGSAADVARTAGAPPSPALESPARGEAGASSTTGRAPPAAAQQAAELEHRMLGSVLGVGAHEVPILREYLCAVSDLRRATLADLQQAVASGDDAQGEAVGRALDETREQRRILLSDLKQRLGEERYDALRSAGGLGLMDSIVDCGR